MQVNIYWNDLSEEGKETMINCGFTPTDAQIKELEPVGQMDTEKRD